VLVGGTAQVVKATGPRLWSASRHARRAGNLCELLRRRIAIDTHVR